MSDKTKVINGFYKGLLFLVWDYLKTGLKAKRLKQNYGTYRIWWFDTKEKRDTFKKGIENKETTFI